MSLVLLLLPAVLLGEALCQMWPVLGCSAGVLDWFLLLVVRLSVGLLLEIFLFGLMRGCSPKLLNSILLCMRAVHAFLFCRCGSLVPKLFGW
jgi:hypothetical protein